MSKFNYIELHLIEHKHFIDALLSFDISFYIHIICDHRSRRMIYEFNEPNMILSDLPLGHLMYLVPKITYITNDGEHMVLIDRYANINKQRFEKIPNNIVGYMNDRIKQMT